MTENDLTKPSMTSKQEVEREFFERLLKEGIHANAVPLGQIFADGDIAVLFFEVGKGPPAYEKEAKRAARALGWKGGRIEVSRMSRTSSLELADRLERMMPGDPAIAWLRRSTGFRILVLVNLGTLCVDYQEGEGFSLASNTTNAAWMV